MKSIYLKAGKTQDVFNDLKDNFDGTLIVTNNEYNLELQSGFSRGNIKGIDFSAGMTYIEFDIVFFEDTRFSLELFSGSPVFFAYCSEGNFQHSFGEQGEKKKLKEHHSGILKSTTSANSILHFEKLVPIKFSVIGMVTKTIASGKNAVLIRKLKNTFFKTEEDYLNISVQNSKIVEKMKELSTLPQKGIIGNILKKRILKSILEIEIKKHTAAFTKMNEMISTLRTEGLDQIKRSYYYGMNFAIDRLGFEARLLSQKAEGGIHKLQLGFKKGLNRMIDDCLILMRTVGHSI